MNKIWMAILFFVSTFFLNSPANAENYVSTTFPSDALLLKAFTISAVPREIIGRRNLHEDKYMVYYHDPDNGMIGSAEVVKLDNNIWIAVIYSGVYAHVIHVIQK